MTKPGLHPATRAAHSRLVYDRQGSGTLALHCLMVLLIAGCSSRAQPAVAPPPAAPDAASSQSYAELNRLLDAHLVQLQGGAARWKRLLDTTDPAVQARIAGEMRAAFGALLQPWPGPAVALDPQREPWFSDRSVDVSLVRLHTHPGVTLLCALLVPRGAPQRRPGLLVLHGAGGDLRSVVSDVDYHHGFAMQLAQRGYVVVAPWNVAATVPTESTLYIKAMAGGWSLPAIELWQLTRALDYLAGLDQVDPGHLGVYGISLGGQQALMLGAVDPRPSLTLVSGFFTDRFAWLFKRGRPTMGPLLQPSDALLVLPAMDFLFDDTNLAALIAPRFFGVECGRRDPRYPRAAAEFRNVMQLYAHAGHPERAAFLPFDGGHETSVATVLPFLERWAATSIEPAGASG